MATATAELLVENGFLTVPQVSRVLCVSRSKVYQMMDGGLLTYAKFGKSRRIPRQAVKDLIERSLVTRSA